MSRPRMDWTGLEVWFLTGSVELYGEETLAQVEQQSRAIAQALQTPVRIVWKPVLTDPESIRRCLTDADSRDEVIGVIAWMHTFSPAKMWISGLSALRKPLLHLHTQSAEALPYAEIDFDFMNLNQSAHGDREFAYALTRLGVDRTTVVGHVSHPSVTVRIDQWMRAAAARHEVRRLRIARFGDNMRFVAVTEGDKTEAEAQLGVQVNTWPVNELAALVSAASSAEIDLLVDEYVDRYDVAPELLPGAERHSLLRDGAAIEVGLRRFLEDGGYGAFTTTFEDLGDLPQLPGLAVQRLIADGYGFGPEGDWKTAILVRALTVMGIGLPGGASIMEDYTYDLTEGAEVILGSHMLEVSHNLTSARPRLEAHALGIGGKPDPVRLVFTADAGTGIVVAMSDLGERFRMVANVVDLIDEPSPLPELPVGRALWRPRPDFATATASWLLAGGAHHTALTTAVGLPIIEAFGEMTGIELVVIDETTSSTREIRDRLRLNQVYHRLSRGF